jgi:hypothetical protein
MIDWLSGSTDKMDLIYESQGPEVRLISINPLEVRYPVYKENHFFSGKADFSGVVGLDSPGSEIISMLGSDSN